MIRNKGCCNTSYRCSRITVLLLTVISYQCVDQCESFDQCPPAQESASYSMDCTVHLNSTVGFFKWASGLGLSSKELSVCHGLDLDCKDQDPDHYLTTNKVKDNILSSQLMINKVSPRDRNETFQCTQWDAVLDQHFVMKTCVMATFKLPEISTCQAQHLDGNTIKVSCRISKFYPDLLCQMFLSSDGQLEEITGAIKYHNNETFYESKAQFYSTTCSTLFQARFPGKYKILVKIHPKVKGQILPEYRVEILTNEINISPVFSLKIESSSELSDGSDSNSPIIFKCLATSYTEPRFRWYLDDVILLDNPNVRSLERKQTTFQYYSSVSTCVLNSNLSQSGQNLRCEVFCNNSKQEGIFESLNATIKIGDIGTGGQPPVFIDNDGKQLRGFYAIPDVNILSLSCQADEEEHTGASRVMSVKCWNPIDYDVEFVSLKRNDTFIPFSLNISEHKNLDDSFCLCSVEDMKQFGNTRSAALKLGYGSEKFSAHRGILRASFSMKTTWFAIGCASGMVMFLLICIVLVLLNKSYKIRALKSMTEPKENIKEVEAGELLP